MIKKVFSLFLTASFFFATSGVALAADVLNDVASRINIAQTQIPLSTCLERGAQRYNATLQIFLFLKRSQCVSLPVVAASRCWISVIIIG